MDALSVISLDAAKTHLVVLNDTFYDTQIEGIIKTAVAMVEQYTDYYMYPRVKTYPITSARTAITDFPLQITGITDVTCLPVASFNVGITQEPLTTYVSYWGWYPPCFGQTGTAIITANIGYADPAGIPQPLIGACYKLITYLFENKDAYMATIPYDIQVMINQLRRSATV